SSTRRRRSGCTSPRYLPEKSSAHGGEDTLKCPRRAGFRRDSQTLLPRLLLDVLNEEQIVLLAPRQQIFVAGLDVVDKLIGDRLRAVPDLSRGNFVNLELRSVRSDELFEQRVRVLQFLEKLAPPLLGVFTEYRQRALE